MNPLAEVAREEVHRFFHGSVMGTVSNLDDVIAPFPRWNKEEADKMWCAAFVFYCCRKAGMVIPVRPKECISCNLAGCGAWEEWAVADNRIMYFAPKSEHNPIPGDIVLFDHVFCDADHDHIGIIVDVTPDALIVAEGNFNNVSCLVRRLRDEHIRAYIRIPEGFVY